MTNWESVEWLLKANQAVSVKVRGTSMFPEFFSGDTVTIEPISISGEPAPLEGSVVLTKTGQRYLIHRLAKATDGSFRTKGDNLLEFDPIPGEILGVITRREKTLLSQLKRLFYRAIRKP